MATLTNFSDYYKTISNSELLFILENPDEHQPLAVEAAKQEFTSRQLSDTEIKEAKELLIAVRIKKEKQKEKVKAIEHKVKTAGNTLFDTLNPIQTSIPTAEKVIRLIVIVFSGLFLYQIFRDYDTLIAYGKDLPRFPLVSSLVLLPFLILPIAVFGFWKRKPVGWTLLTVFLTFSIVGVMWALFQAFSWRSSGIDGIDNLFPRPSPLTYILQLLFFVGTLYVLYKKEIREIFPVSRNHMQTTIAITAVVSFFLIMAVS